ncbi:MAG: MarR family transcriptional regulator [Acidobacteriota bacterium]
MSLREELGFPRPIESRAHETVLGVILAADLLAKECARVVRPCGLTEAQFNVLMLLRYQSEEGGLDQSTLGRMLVVNRSNVTGLVDRMERSGWVRRTPDVSDRRVKLVRVTPAGLKVLARAEKAYFQRLEAVVGVLAVEERNTLTRALEKLRRELNRG